MKNLLVKLFLSKTGTLHWFISDQASNFGTILLGATSTIALFSGLFYLQRVRKEKRFEKMSNVAEESLNYLDLFIFQFTDWTSKSSSCFVYNGNDKANKSQFEAVPESERAIPEKIFNDDPYELHNHCKNFKNMMEGFFKAKNKTFCLSNNNLIAKFEKLEKTLQMLPIKLGSYHLNDRGDILRGARKTEKWAFISQDVPDQAAKSFEFIKSELREIILHKKERFLFAKLSKLFPRNMKRIKRKFILKRNIRSNHDSGTYFESNKSN